MVCRYFFSQVHIFEIYPLEALGGKIICFWLLDSPNLTRRKRTEKENVLGI
jgi:hypothetical protein